MHTEMVLYRVNVYIYLHRYLKRPLWRGISNTYSTDRSTDIGGAIHSFLVIPPIYRYVTHLPITIKRGFRETSGQRAFKYLFGEGGATVRAGDSRGHQYPKISCAEYPLPEKDPSVRVSRKRSSAKGLKKGKSRVSKKARAGSQTKIYGYCIMTGTNKIPLKSAFKRADRRGNKRVRLGELVRTLSGDRYPANAINQYHEQTPRTKKGFRQWDGHNRTIFGPSKSATRDPDDKEATWQQRYERENAMNEATEGIDYERRPSGNISREQQLDVWKNNLIWGDDPKINGDDNEEEYDGEEYYDDDQTPEEVQDIIDGLKKELDKPMTELQKEDLKERIAEYEDQLRKMDVGGAKKNRKTKSKRKANRKTNRKTKSKRKAKKMTKKKAKRKAKGNTRKSRR